MGLEAKLEEIQLPKNYHWVETLSITSATPLELEDVHDDLKREAELYVPTFSATNCHNGCNQPDMCVLPVTQKVSRLQTPA